MAEKCIYFNIYYNFTTYINSNWKISMKKTSLVLLAAGMGSRYGSLKQMDEFGPNGETIMDYSIYDAIRAGFNHIVFIIRDSFREAFEEKFKNRFGNEIQVDFVSQELIKGTGDFKVPATRVKPWGTGHALLMASEVVSGNFAVVNADDYYGVEAYTTLVDFLSKNQDDFCIVSYHLQNTLSDHGHVNRGVCFEDEDGNLKDVVETIQISKDASGNIYYPVEGGIKTLSPETKVSMNMFGFTPKFFASAKKQFEDFLKNHGQEEKSEFYIPKVLDYGIKNENLNIQILVSPSQWFGVTYKEDKPVVQARLSELIEQGVYPNNLWNN